MFKIVIKPAPKITEDNENLRLKNKNINKIFWQKLNHFEKMLQENKHMSPQLYYHNIKDAHIHEAIKLNEEKSNDEGYFKVTENYIWVKRKFHVYHELLHLSSSIIYDNLYYCGFSQETYHYTIGEGLNEGYTSLLEYRYFYYDGAEMCYELEMIIARLIEEIIGKNTMESLYFKADLFNLVKELEKYASYNEIYNFICKLDILSEIVNSNFLYYSLYPLISILTKSLLKFIEKCKIKKLNIDLQNKKITEEEYHEILNDFYDVTKDLCKNHNSKVLTRKK